DRAYSLQVDSKQIVHEKISVIYEALNIRLQPQKEPNLIPLTLPPRPLSAFIDPPLELWESLTKDNFKKRNLSIYLSTIKETRVIGSTTYPSYITAVKLSSKEEIFGSTNKIWPSRLHSTLTIQTVEMIQKIINLEFYKLDLLNKEDYPSLLKILRGSIGDRKVTAKLDPELKAQKPPTIYNLDINPKRFVYNAYTIELLNIP
ncbi:13062_t:CDS:2, partial [Gigaspora rosea]